MKTPSDAIANTLRTRPSLIFRLRDWKDGDTWREFYDIYYNYVYRHARGSGLNHHEAEDVTQEVFQRVAHNIKKFEPQPQPGAFRRWLGNQARWRVLDKLRELGKEPAVSRESEDPLVNVAAVDAEELRLEEEWRRQLYETSLQRVAAKVNPKHYQVFILHHAEGWSLKKISSELGVGQASAYVINHRLKGMLQKEIKTLEKVLD